MEHSKIRRFNEIALKLCLVFGVIAASAGTIGVLIGNRPFDYALALTVLGLGGIGFGYAAVRLRQRR
jgi:energy-converting hydrogenase Eha subunit H